MGAWLCRHSYVVTSARATSWLADIDFLRYVAILAQYLGSSFAKRLSVDNITDGRSYLYRKPPSQVARCYSSRLIESIVGM